MIKVVETTLASGKVINTVTGDIVAHYYIDETPLLAKCHPSDRQQCLTLINKKYKMSAL